MQKSIQVHFLPQLVELEALRGATVVVVDVLRATTTIAQALAAGAAEVVPCAEIEDVQQQAVGRERESIVLGGERGGVKIDLFDLGNSPTEYTEEAVSGKSVLFTTTNGTRALAACREAYRVVLGAAVNLQAVCDAVADTMNVQIVCAGTDGQVTREDVLLAGAIVYQRTKKEETPTELNDSAQLAVAAWRSVVARAIGAGVALGDYLATELRSTGGGRNLLRIGQEDDLVIAAQVDSVPVVPELDLQAWRIGLT